jgi:hypothetical protein
MRGLEPENRCHPSTTAGIPERDSRNFSLQQEERAASFLLMWILPADVLRVSGS